VEAPLAQLARRIASLDSVPLWWQAEKAKRTGPRGDSCLLLAHLTDVMGSCTHAEGGGAPNGGMLIESGAADRMTATSRLLREIAMQEPALCGGPFQTDRQQWTQTGRHGLSAAGRKGPSKTAFRLPSQAPDNVTAVKPFGFGLYTSPATSRGRSMWRASCPRPVSAIPPALAYLALECGERRGRRRNR